MMIFIVFVYTATCNCYIMINGDRAVCMFYYYSCCIILIDNLLFL
jgi:hypothetical protein